MRFIVNILCVILALTCNAQTNKNDTLLSSDTLNINKSKYIVQLQKNNVFKIICQNDTLIERDYYPSDTRFLDFNGDGFVDIYVTFLSNVPGLNDLFLFDNLSGCFKKIEGFRDFEDAKKIGKGYYYSYHRSGCADLNWDSDLFIIKDFKTVKLANMHAVQCDDKPEKYINVYKMTSSESILIENINPTKVKNNKWSFIFKYWKRNYKKLTMWSKMVLKIS